MGDGGIVCIARDVTEQRERERQYRQQKRRLQTIVENVPIVLFAFEPDGTMTLSEGRAWKGSASNRAKRSVSRCSSCTPMYPK